MKHFTLALNFLLLSVVLFSCKKEVSDSNYQSFASQQPAQVVNGPVLTGRAGTETGSCPATTVTLFAGQTIDAGTVTVTNDSAFIYVTYTTANGYTLTQTHLYVGDCALVTVNNAGNPIPGHFPYSAMHTNITSYTYVIPISVINGCGCIAAHAVVQKLSATGQVIDQQTGWGDGTRINPTGNWATKFTYCTCL